MNRKRESNRRSPSGVARDVPGIGCVTRSITRTPIDRARQLLPIALLFGVCFFAFIVHKRYPLKGW